MDKVVEAQFNNAVVVKTLDIRYAFTNAATREVYQEATHKKLKFLSGESLTAIGVSNLTPDVIYQTAGAAAIDLYLPEDLVLQAGFVTKANLGIAFDIPIGVAGLLIPRSSNGKQDFQVMLSNTVGLIDSDYKGTLWAQFTTLNGAGPTVNLKQGERFAQLIFIPYIKANPVESLWDSFKDSTERGTLGLGEGTGSQTNA